MADTVDKPVPANQSNSVLEPLVIVRSQHPVSRKDIDLEALKVLYRLRDAGHVAYLVGGGVRDLFLGKTPKDFDISTDARPGELRKLFKNSRIIGRRFRLVQVYYRGNKIIEVSTFRQPSEFDIANEDEVLAADNTFGTPADDAFRRDLTINALFYEVENFSIIDYTGGVKDLRDGIIRIIGDPDRRVVRDPVRMMRAVRHAARSNFTIEPITWEAICRHRDKLTLCPTSRIRDELFRDLQGGASREWARLCLESGLFQVLFPFYAPLLARDPVTGSTASKLLTLFGVIDRLRGEGQPLPEHILLALVCVPWAQEEMGLVATVDPGRQSHQRTQELSAALAVHLEHLNIKRAVRDQMAGLLATLPVFYQHAGKGDWPAWLARKSYFDTGIMFCRLYQEALGEAEPEPLAFEPLKSTRSPRKRPPRRRGRGAAIVTQSTGGGIFGFKK